MKDETFVVELGGFYAQVARNGGVGWGQREVATRLTAAAARKVVKLFPNATIQPT